MARAPRIRTIRLEVRRTAEPTPAQWQKLEAILNARQHKARLKLSLTVRKKIWDICCVFSSSDQATTNAISENTVIADIKKWQANTKNLRRRTWGQQATRPKPKTRENLISTYLRPLCIEDRSWYQLEFLAAVFDAAVATSELVLLNLQNPKIAGLPGHELWFLWVILIDKTLRSEGFRTSAASGDKSASDSPFVVFIQTLQALLPERCQRRKTGGSIAKGIQDARKGYGHFAPDLLTTALAHRGLGQQSFTPNGQIE
jgi:hypothetical protein